MKRKSYFKVRLIGKSIDFLRRRSFDRGRALVNLLPTSTLLGRRNQSHFRFEADQLNSFGVEAFIRYRDKLLSARRLSSEKFSQSQFDFQLTSKLLSLIEALI